MSLKIQFLPPKHGWMTIVLNGDGQEYTESVSHIPENSLTSFCWSLIRLSNGVQQDECRWFLEPGYSVWMFRRKADDVVLEIERRDESVFGYQLPLKSFLKKAKNALLKLSKDSCWTEGSPWNGGFPYKDFEKLP